MYGGAIYSQLSTYSGRALTHDQELHGLTGNSASFRGGAVYTEYGSPQISQCTFADNSAGEGGAICTTYSTSVISNCVFAWNAAASYGSAFRRVLGGSATITNSIVWGKWADQRPPSRVPQR